MIYFLKKTCPTKKGVYLQIYQSYYDPTTKSKKQKSYKAIGYIEELKEQGIKDPIAYFTDIVKQMNAEMECTKELQISEVSTTMNAGYFLVKAMFDLLDMDSIVNLVASSYKSRYPFSDMLRSLVYAQIISPGSKYKAYEKVIPSIYGARPYSYDQILDAVNFIGADYQKFIEILNHQISKLWKRSTDKVYFDCTNYYFEIDLENEFLRKGPSKENRKEPLLGQALLLDAEQIPLDTEFYPGNESEKPFIRKRIEEMKAKNNVKGKVIQVADKGLNCARNIYAAVVESNDGYIFSKSIKGKSLPQEQREWILAKDDELNTWVSVREHEGNLLYKYKELKELHTNGKITDYATIKYKCFINPEDKKEEEFTVKEKRILTYNPALAKKQKLEIYKEVDKLSKLMRCKEALKESLGDSAKYVNLDAIDENGKSVKVICSLNEEKIQEDLMYAGYNMLITSEIKADPQEIYNVYHNLWRIEESFRLLKTYLEARPVFVSNKNTIYGHFLICYISLTIMRLLELKTFQDEIPAPQLFEFIRQYNVTKTNEESYINNATSSDTYLKIKQKLGLAKLGNVFLRKKDIDQLLETELDV